jgi:hypothetical protein
MLKLPRRGPLDPYRWTELATYNSERARGIVHMPEWVRLMAAEQEAFNREQERLGRVIR